MSDQNVTPARELLSDAPEQQYIRFTLSDRVQHLVMLLSFTTLAITGLVQKFALNSVSVFLVRVWGGVENIRSTHHVAATLLMLVAAFAGRERILAAYRRAVAEGYRFFSYGDAMFIS